MSPSTSNSFEIIKKQASVLLKKSSATFLLVCNGSGEVIVNINLGSNTLSRDKMAAYVSELGTIIHSLSKSIRNREPESVELYFDDEIVTLQRVGEFVVILGHQKDAVKKNLVSSFARPLKQLVASLQEELT